MNPPTRYMVLVWSGFWAVAHGGEHFYSRASAEDFSRGFSGWHTRTRVISTDELATAFGLPVPPEDYPVD